MKFELFEEKTLIGDREGKLLLLLPDSCQVASGVSQHSATLFFWEHLSSYMQRTQKRLNQEKFFNCPVQE